MKTLSTLEAAKIMHKDPQYIRKGLRTGRLPFGSAIIIHHRYSYHISPGRFAAYMGISEADMEAVLHANTKLS